MFHIHGGGSFVLPTETSLDAAPPTSWAGRQVCTVDALTTQQTLYLRTYTGVSYHSLSVDHNPLTKLFSAALLTFLLTKLEPANSLVRIKNELYRFLVSDLISHYALPLPDGWSSDTNDMIIIVP